MFGNGFRQASILVRKVSAQGRFHIAELIAFHPAKPFVVATALCRRAAVSNNSGSLDTATRLQLKDGF
jgi:hypothetical protein